MLPAYRKINYMKNLLFSKVLLQKFLIKLNVQYLKKTFKPILVRLVLLTLQISRTTQYKLLIVAGSAQKQMLKIKKN